MPRLKKEKKLESPPDVPVVPIVVEEIVKPAKLSADFGREDLNQLRDRVNQLIDYIN